MPYQGSITLVDLSDGTSGIDSATIYLYKRAAADATVTGPSGTLRYTFSNHTLTAEQQSYFNEWQQSIPSGTNPIWIIAATATASADVGYDDILYTEWSSPTIMAQDGQGGEHGINTATVYIYKRVGSSEPTPTAPSNTTYTFSNGSFTVPTGWSKTIPATDNGKPCYVSSAAAIGNGTTATLVWSTPVILVEDGAQGPQGVSVTSERELYWLKINSTNPSQIIWDSTHSQPSQTIYSDDRTNAWTSIVPTYVSGGTYYTCIEASLSDGTKVWSAPVINNALTNTSSNTALMGGHFIYLGSASTSGLTPASANVVQTIENTRQEDVTYDPTQWQYNVHIGSNGIALRFNELNYSTWTTTGLHLFEPPNGSTQGAEAAALTTDGLVIAKGRVYLPGAGITNENYYPINYGGSSSDYKIRIWAGEDSEESDEEISIRKAKFIVTEGGYLYAQEGTFSGSITGARISSSTVTTDNFSFASASNDNYIEGTFNDENGKHSLIICADRLLIHNDEDDGEYNVNVQDKFIDYDTTLGTHYDNIQDLYDTTSGLSTTLSDLTTYTQSNINNLQDFVNNFNNFLSLANNNTQISSNTGRVVLKILSNEIQMYNLDTSNYITKWSNNIMEGTQASFSSSLQIGNFAFTSVNGNLRLVKVN